MNTNKHETGFTLIELLVVISIISLLSSIVLASLNAARVRGYDAAVKENLAGVRSQAELIYDTDGDYDAVCAANSVTQNQTVMLALNAASFAGAGNETSDVCGKPASGAANNWAAAAPLRSGGAWCVDSTGVSRSTQGGGATPYTAVSGAGTAALTNANDLACN
ncbi:MAG: prepilin-type N-terminal cleavage/methylation domain-containing protein [Patescibacteria group bacterium]|nr:prepilin-type N-terminal cleavage/methylation domain-containing protein [bacterium]MDZ4240905.1 prepilin-type N-terminal cleavage/methylation domain-containing protein [Patescibacteria group bacterium]